MVSTPSGPVNRRPSKQNARGPLTIVACNPCRISKTKCDGVRPSCQRCIDRSDKCHYVADPDMHPIQRVTKAIQELKLRIRDHEEFFRLMTTVSEADALQLLARLRRGEEIASLIDAGRQMRSVRSAPHEMLESPLRRRASANGIIDNVPIETRHASEHLAAIVDGARLPLLEPPVHLANNLPRLDTRNSLRQSKTERSDQAKDQSPNS